MKIEFLREEISHKKLNTHQQCSKKMYDLVRENKNNTQQSVRWKFCEHTNYSQKQPRRCNDDERKTRPKFSIKIAKVNAIFFEHVTNTFQPNIWLFVG